MPNKIYNNTRKIYLASCLYDCIEDNNIRAIKKLLIENGANPNIIIPDRGITPFHLAVGSGDEETANEITKIFLSYEGDPNIKSDENLTPVHIAAAWGRLKVLKTLLNCGGDPTLTDEDGYTSLDLAKQENHISVVDFLENYLIDLNSETNLNKLFDMTLDKVIVNNGSIVAEYAVSDQNDPGSVTYDPKNALESLPTEIVNSYVHNWCMKHSPFEQEGTCYELDKNTITENNINNQNKSFPSINCNIKENIKSNDIEISNNKIVHFNIISNDSNESSIKCNNILKYTSKATDKNSKLNTSSEESCIKLNNSRESGILTIPSSDISEEQNLIDLLNNCIIINDSQAETASNSAYITCDSVNSFEKNICNSIITLDLTDNTQNLTSDKSQNIEIKEKDNNTKNTEIIETFNDLTTNVNHVTNIPCQLSKNELEESIVSITEEYKYIDKEENIILIEKRLLKNPKSDDVKSICSANTNISSKVSSLPSVLDYDTDVLRSELTIRGEPPGPITKTTKRVYLRKLKKLKKNNNVILHVAKQNENNNRVYSMELEKTIRHPNWTNDLTTYKALDMIVSKQFTNPDPNKRWREGVTKASFTYLLLDPRITINLPSRSEKLPLEESWQIFLKAIFYVGKGKRSRPYSHLYQAVTHWNQKEEKKCKRNKKIEYILDIWKEEFGVICLHIFQNVIPVEAYTREAAMINALNLQNLCNSKSGDFYGISATWPERQKRLLGVYLLYRALLIFLNEGERQLRPDDIGK